MQTDSFDLQVAAIEPKTCRGIEVEIANAKRNFFIINRDISGAYTNNCPVETWVLDIPKLGSTNGNFLLKERSFAGGNGLRFAGNGLQWVLIRPEDRNLDGDIAWL